MFIAEKWLIRKSIPLLFSFLNRSGRTRWPVTRSEISICIQLTSFVSLCTSGYFKKSRHAPPLKSVGIYGSGRNNWFPCFIILCMFEWLFFFVFLLLDISDILLFLPSSKIYFFLLHFYISVLPINFSVFLSPIFLTDIPTFQISSCIYYYTMDSLIFPSIYWSTLFFSSLTLEFYICKIIYIKFQIYTYIYIIYSLVVDLLINIL